MIVDVPDTDPEVRSLVGTMIPAALQGRRGPDRTPMRADVVYDAERRHLKVILVGSIEDTSTLLAAIRARLERM